MGRNYRPISKSKRKGMVMEKCERCGLYGGEMIVERTLVDRRLYVSETIGCSLCTERDYWLENVDSEQVENPDKCRMVNDGI